jgi:hypothetical protein
MKPVKLIKTYWHETYFKLLVDKHLRDVFRIQNGLKQVDALSPFFVIFALDNTIRRDWNVMGCTSFCPCWWWQFIDKKKTQIQKEEKHKTKPPRDDSN